MTIALPTLIVSRQPRHAGSDWDHARSWFGGKPRLGRQPWPRNALQKPFHFVAQIDLDEVAREVARSGSRLRLPDGALAFFIGTDSKGMATGTVVYVPRSEPGEPTEPPPDAPAVLSPAGRIFPSTFGPDAPRLFPFWPVDITTLDIEPNVPPDTDDEDDRFEATEALLKAQVAAVDRLFTRREFFLEAKEAFKLLGDAHPFWWHTAEHYAACLRTDLVDTVPHLLDYHRRSVDRARTRSASLQPTGVAGLLSALGLRSAQKSPDVQKAEEELIRCERVLEKFTRLVPEFERFVQDVSDWIGEKDPWEFMPHEAVEELKSIFERGKKNFGEFRRNTPQFFDQLETETLLALATADDRAYATMPEALRTLINTKYLLPSSYWHQMFGWGVDIQGAVWGYEDQVLLLQLVYDDMMHWDFGDIGAYQFWISPNDLILGNWDAVKVTFEGH